MTPPDSDAREVLFKKGWSDGFRKGSDAAWKNAMSKCARHGVAKAECHDRQCAACDHPCGQHYWDGRWCQVIGCKCGDFQDAEAAPVSLPLPLAQRILAALEEHAVIGAVSNPGRFSALAAELRALLVTK